MPPASIPPQITARIQCQADGTTVIGFSPRATDLEDVRTALRRHMAQGPLAAESMLGGPVEYRVRLKLTDCSALCRTRYRVCAAGVTDHINMLLWIYEIAQHWTLRP